MITDELMGKFSVLTRKINQLEHSIRSVEWLITTEPSNRKFVEDKEKLKKRLNTQKNKLKKLLHETVKA